MELEIFGYIENCLNLIRESKEDAEYAREVLGKFFYDIFEEEEEFTNVFTRLKSLDSIKEKIVRQNFFFRYKEPERFLANLSDLIGVRLECRFMDDEERLYRRLCRIFNQEEVGGYFKSDLSEHIFLKISNQPEVQNNGFKIYRLDGKFVQDDIAFNFELQIKSFVNLFWGEIDHKVLYKNYSYMLSEDFVREVLYSVKGNLEMIDSQLMLINDHLSDIEQTDEIIDKNQLIKLVTKSIHDLFLVKFKKQTAIVLNFREPISLLMNYLFSKVYYERFEKPSSYFIRLMDRLDEINQEDIRFGDYISLGGFDQLQLEQSYRLAKGINSIVNLDLKWNMLLVILFAIDEDENQTSFISFIEYINFRILHSIREVANYKLDRDSFADDLVYALGDGVIDLFFQEYSIEFFSEQNFGAIKKSVIRALGKEREDMERIAELFERYLSEEIIL